MIHRRTVLAKPTLDIRQEMSRFKPPYQAPVNHAFHHLAYATGEGNGAVAGRETFVLPRLWYGNDYGFTPASRKGAFYPYAVVGGQ